jgi:hypothetical protein
LQKLNDSQANEAEKLQAKLKELDRIEIELSNEIRDMGDA